MRADDWDGGGNRERPRPRNLGQGRDGNLFRWRQLRPFPRLLATLAKPSSRSDCAETLAQLREIAATAYQRCYNAALACGGEPLIWLTGIHRRRAQRGRASGRRGTGQEQSAAAWPRIRHLRRCQPVIGRPEVGERLARSGTDKLNVRAARLPQNLPDA